MNRHMTGHRGGSRRHAAAMAGAALLMLLALALALPFAGHLLVVEDARAQASPAEPQTNPRADYWRMVRRGVEGYSAVRGPEANVLIQSGGDDWRRIRNGPVIDYGGWFLALVVLGIAAFFMLRGRIRLERGRSGQTILRWSAGERLMHWYTATLFILLAITGLSLLFGRAVLIPLLGHQAFAAYAGVAKGLHNYLGPLFIVGILLEIVYWMKFNIPGKGDWEWFKRGGGMIGKRHPSAGKMNAGEKVWFWVIFTMGLTVSITGLVLDFPNLGQGREAMQIANLLHGAAALIFVGFALGHIYIGTLGTEGALEGMVHGYVDVNWARQHHDLWYAEKIREAGREGEAAEAPAGPSDVRPQVSR